MRMRLTDGFLMGLQHGPNVNTHAADTFLLRLRRSPNVDALDLRRG